MTRTTAGTTADTTAGAAGVRAAPAAVRERDLTLPAAGCVTDIRLPDPCWAPDARTVAVSLSAPGGQACVTAPACGTQTTSAVGGRYTVHVPAGTYALQASDAGALTAARTVVAAPAAVIRAPIGQMTSVPSR